MTQAIADKWEVDMDTAWEDLPEDVRHCFLYGTNGERVYVSYRNRYGRRRSYMTNFEGIVPNLERRYRETDSDWSREKIEEYMTLRPCPECNGARLRPESLAVLVGGLGVHEFTRMSARRAIEWLDALELTDTERQIARLILREIDERLRFLDNVGVGYLSLDRAAATLSGGEAQRIRLATQIGSSLVGVLYILDEPSIGLHQRDNERLIGTLERLRDLGNTVIVVEHDEGTMRAADHLVDLGPGAGEHGGHLVAQGTPAQVMRVPGSATGQFLSGKREIAVPSRRRRPSGYVEIEGAAQHNLRGIDVKVPLGRALLRDRGVRLGQVHARERGALQGGGQPPAPRQAAARRAPAHQRARPGRQDHQHRPVADRAHAALEPGHLHRAVRPHPRALLAHPGGAGTRDTSRAASRSTSRAGAARSAAATARSRSRCTSCPTCTCRASSATASATTARRSRCASRARRSPTCST